MKVKAAVKRICHACRRVKRRKRWFIYCDANPKHKQRQGFATLSAAASSSSSSSSSSSTSCACVSLAAAATTTSSRSLTTASVVSTHLSSALASSSSSSALLRLPLYPASILRFASSATSAPSSASAASSASSDSDAEALRKYSYTPTYEELVETEIDYAHFFNSSQAYLKEMVTKLD